MSAKALLIACFLALPLCVPASTHALPLEIPQPHDKEFWQAIAKNDYNPPVGESASALWRPLSELLASPDPELRDEVGYSTFASWIYAKRLLSPDDLRGLIAQLSRNLKQDVGSTGTDAIFRRSFSALVLSVVAARDNAAPFLEEKEFRGLLQDALEYLDAEKDLRGCEPGKGWFHSAAHTADLLKFLGRSRYLQPADQAAITDGILRKLRNSAVVFTFGEDERMARALLSLVARKDFDAQGFRQRLTNAKPSPPTAALPDVAVLRGNQNVKNMLSKLEVLLLSQPADAGPQFKETAAAVQDTLKGTF